MSAPNRSTQQDRFRKIVPAIQRYLDQPQIMLAGVTFTPASLVQFFQDQVKLLDDATQARAALRQAVQAIHENKTTKGPILRAFNGLVLSMYANQPTVLAEFGLPPRKSPTTTVETKALAVQRNLATRDARHTMGKRQRLKVKGVVPSPEPAPAASAKPEPVPRLPSPAPAQAQAPSNGATPPAGSGATPQAGTPATLPTGPPTHT